MTSEHEMTISIRRYRPEVDAAPHWESYRIAASPGMTVLAGLHRVREEIDATLAWRYSCRMGVCGSCAMIINGKPSLACSTQMRQVDEANIRLEALWNFSIVKDLVTDFAPAFDRHRRHKPYIVRSDSAALRQTRQELRQTPAELLDYMQFAHCIKCCACIAACPTVAIDQEFHGPMPLMAAHRYNADSRDDGFDERKHVVTERNGISHCHYAGECSRVCPKGVDPARAIQLMRRDLVADLFRAARRAPAKPVLPVTERSRLDDDELRPPEFTVSRRSDD